MFMRTTFQKRADGTKVGYYQLAESVWNRKRKRSETKIVHTCGRVGDGESEEALVRLAKSILKRLSPEEVVAATPGWRVQDAWPYGDIYVLEALWRRLGIADIIAEKVKGRRIEYSVERALFAMVANRACAPYSKLYCYEEWLQEEVRVEGTEDLALHHLYRAMDFLEAQKTEIEKEIFFKVADLLNLDVELIFYDTTSLHFETDQEDDDGGDAEDGSARGEDVDLEKGEGTPSAEALRKRGLAKNKRGDVPQIVVGLAITRDGIPVRHWVFPGNTVDVTTVEQVKEDLRGWRLTRCIFVGDAGMVSEENLRTLALGGGKYIVIVPLRRGNEVTEMVLSRPGRFKTVAENLRVKEVVVGDGERRRRYALCHNPQEERRERKHREEILKQLQAELESLRYLDGETHSKRVCELVASRRYGRFLRLDRGGRPQINRAKVRSEQRLDGKFVVRSNDDTLLPEDMALGGKQLLRVEDMWRTLKTALKLRPVYHWVAHRIRAHVAISMLALLLERVAELACGDTWRNIRADLRKIKLAQLSGPGETVWQVTDPRPETANRLKSLKIKNPPPILRID